MDPSEYRTDSGARRLLTALISGGERLAAAVGQPVWFHIFGGMRNNVSSTRKMPDFDLACVCDLGDPQEYGLELVSRSARGAVNIRLKFVGSPQQKLKLMIHLEESLHFLVYYSNLPSLGDHWFEEEGGETFLSTRNIRRMQKMIGEILGAEASETGAAASASFPVSSEEKFLRMYDFFRERLDAETRGNVFFGTVVPQTIIPIVRRELGRGTLDFDLVTLLDCRPSAECVRRMQRESGLPDKAADRIAAAGLTLNAKIDKVGIAHRGVDFGVSMSLGGALDAFPGHKEVLVKLKDGLTEAVPECSFPKTFHLKTVMAHMAEDMRNDPDSRTDDEAVLLNRVISRTISAYRSQYLPSFFDSRANLLVDLSDEALEAAGDRDKRSKAVEKREKAIARLEHLRDNLGDLLATCHSKPMVTSRFVINIARAVFDSPAVDWEGLLPRVQTVRAVLSLLDYSDHSQETPVERAFSDDLLEQATKVILDGVAAGRQPPQIGAELYSSLSGRLPSALASSFLAEFGAPAGVAAGVASLVGGLIQGRGRVDAGEVVPAVAPGILGDLGAPPDVAEAFTGLLGALLSKR